MLRVGRQARGVVCALGGHPWVTELVKNSYGPGNQVFIRSDGNAAVPGHWPWRVGSRARSSPGPDCRGSSLPAALTPHHHLPSLPYFGGVEGGRGRVLTSLPALQLL